MHVTSVLALSRPPPYPPAAAFIVLSPARFDPAVVDDATATAEKSLSHPPGDRPSHRRTLAGLRPRRGWELHPGVRSPDRLSARERAADKARDLVGSWSFTIPAAALVAVGIVLALRHDRQAGPVAVLGVVLSGLAVVGLSLVLMAASRADRIAGEAALHQLDSDRRAAAGITELRDEVEQLRVDVARLTARLETAAGRSRPEGLPR
jgi:hypothetical protein